MAKRKKERRRKDAQTAPPPPTSPPRWSVKTTLSWLGLLLLLAFALGALVGVKEALLKH